MIIGPDNIQCEIARVISDEGYFALRNQDFIEICPNPTWGIHVDMKNIEALIIIVKIYLELLRADKNELKGIIAYIRGSSLTMEDITRIDSIIPKAHRFRRGIGFKTDGQGIEIWIFAQMKDQAKL